MLRSEFRLPSVISEDAPPDRKAPIRVKFEIPYFTISGIQVSEHMFHMRMIFVSSAKSDIFSTVHLIIWSNHYYKSEDLHKR